MKIISSAFDDLLEAKTPRTPVGSPARGTCQFHQPDLMRFKTTPDRGRSDQMDLMLSDEGDRLLSEQMLDHYDWTPLEFADASTQT